MLKIFANSSKHFDSKDNIRQQEANLKVLQNMIKLLPDDLPTKEMYENQMHFFTERLKESKSISKFIAS